MFVCICMQHGWADGLVGGFPPRQLVLVCSYGNLLGQVWGWCTLEPGLGPKWQILLPLTVSMQYPLGFSFLLIVCGVCFKLIILLTMLSLSLLLDSVGRLCFLIVASRYMHFITLKEYFQIVYSVTRNICYNLLPASCRNQGLRYANFPDGNCRTHWDCDTGHPHPVCCPNGQGFDVLTSACVVDPACTDICPKEYSGTVTVLYYF
jgi:hypothetical protein